MASGTAPPLLVIALVLAGSTSLFLAATAWARRRVPGARELAVLLVGSALYSLAYAFELLRSDLDGILAFVSLVYLALAIMIPAFLAFAWWITTGKGLPVPLLAALVAWGLLAFAAVLTVRSHSFFYLNPRVSTDGPYPVIGFGRGPLYLVNFAMIELVAIAGAVLLAIRASRSVGRQRLQSIVIALGGSFPIAAGLGRLTGLVPEWFDPAPLSFAATGAFTAFGMFRLGLVEIVPAARELAIDALRDGFVVTDTHGAVVDANRAARSLLGWPEELGAGERNLGSAAGGAFVGLLAEGAGKVEVRLAGGEAATGEDAGDARERHIRANAYPILSPRGDVRGLSLLLVDQTETVELLERLKELADKDGLTGLLNRRRFLELASREIALAARTPRPMALILVDVDRFKRVNDRHGHEAGDAVLAELSRRLVATFRNVDLVGRYGGEEFVVLLTAAESVDVELAAERARRAVEAASVPWNGLELRITASFGCARVSEERGRVDSARVAEILAETLRRADAALYRAKEAGRNRVETAG